MIIIASYKVHRLDVSLFVWDDVRYGKKENIYCLSLFFTFKDIIIMTLFFFLILYKDIFSFLFFNVVIKRLSTDNVHVYNGLKIKGFIFFLIT
jgi:hypothetical protein